MELDFVDFPTNYNDDNDVVDYKNCYVDVLQARDKNERS